MFMRGLLVVFAGLLLPVAARAQSESPNEPPLLLPNEAARPAAGVLPVDDGFDDLFPGPVVVTPSGAGGVTGWVIIEIKGGLPIILPVGDFPTVPTAPQGSQGQMNDDTLDDFVVISSSGTATVLIGSPGTQTGPTEVTPMLTDVPANGVVLPSCPLPARLISTLDFGGTARDDIIVGGPSGVKLYRDDPTSTFVEWVVPGVPVSPVSPINVTDIAVGDVNGDLRDDIAIACGTPGPAGTGSGAVHVWTQNANGSFSLATSFATTGPSPVASVELVELNDDAFDDLVLAVHHYTGTTGPYTATLRVHLNPGTGVFSPTANHTSPTYSSMAGVVPTYGAAGLIDADTDVDLVYTCTDSIAYPPGSFAQYTPPLVLFHLDNRLNENPASIAWASRATRFSGRAPDPILYEPPASSFDLLPGGTAGLHLIWNVAQAAGFATSDELDTLAFNLTFPNNGNGFVEDDPSVFETSNQPFDPPGDGATADIGTGEIAGGPFADIVVPNFVSNSLTLAYGNGDCGFPEIHYVTNIASAPGGYIGGPRRVALHDLNRDGFADAVVGSDFLSWTGDWDSGLTLLHSNGAIGMAEVEDKSFPHAGELVVGDVDGDGFKDFVKTRRLGVSAPQDLEIHFGSLAGIIDDDRVPYTISVGSPAVLTGGLDLLDMDGDADLDVVSSFALPSSGGGYDVGVALFRNTWPTTQGLTLEHNVFATNQPMPDVESVVLGAVNGSTHVDVAVGLRNGRLWFARGTGSTPAFAAQDFDDEAELLGGGSLAIARVSDDDNKDIVSCKGWPAAQSVVQVLYATSTNDFIVSELAGWCPQDVDGANRPIVGDFDGDGVMDLAIVHGAQQVTIVRGPF